MPDQLLDLLFNSLTDHGFSAEDDRFGRLSGFKVIFQVLMSIQN